MFTDATPERTERMFHYLDADNTGYIDYLGWSQTVKLQVRLLAADVVCNVRPHDSFSKHTVAIVCLRLVAIVQPQPYGTACGLLLSSTGCEEGSIITTNF